MVSSVLNNILSYKKTYNTLYSFQMSLYNMGIVGIIAPTFLDKLLKHQPIYKYSTHTALQLVRQSVNIFEDLRFSCTGGCPKSPDGSSSFEESRLGETKWLYWNTAARLCSAVENVLLFTSSSLENIPSFAQGEILFYISQLLSAILGVLGTAVRKLECVFMTKNSYAQLNFFSEVF